MATKTILTLLCGLALAAPAFGQSAPQPASRSEFAGMFTSWSGVNRESLRVENQPAPTATPASSQDGIRQNQAAVSLGERVGEVVRQGDCQEGERMARAAGDFALVQAVRDYCRRQGSAG